MSALGPVGDRGQRYAVTMLMTDGKTMRVGWQDTPEGGLVDAMGLAPYCAVITVTDREDPDVEPTKFKFRDQELSIPKRPGRDRKRRLGKRRKR